MATARPELYDRSPNWGGGIRNTTTIALAPLSDQDTASVVAEILREDSLPPRTHALLLERAGGNPLYAEEFARLIRDRRAVASDDGLTVPHGIQAVIAARLDTLTAERKALLQAAAVVGKVFWAGALASITRMPKESILANLHELGRKELVRRVRTSSLAGDVEYLFWHVLVRDVAYAQIPRAERARMHVAAAEWIERVAGDRAVDHAEFLAHHYRVAVELLRATHVESAAMESRAADWKIRAAERVRHLDPKRSARYYSEALELLPRRDSRVAPTLVAGAEASVIAGRPDLAKAETDVLTAVDLYLAEGDEVAAADALRVLSFIRVFGDAGIEERLQPIQEALRMLERHPPTPELAKAYERLSLHYTHVGDMERLREIVPRTLTLLEQFGLRDDAALTESRMLVDCSTMTTDQVLENFEQLVRRVLDPELGYGSYAALMVLQNMAAAMQLAGAPLVRVTAVAEQAITLSAARGLSAPNLFIKANSMDLLYAAGDWQRALERAHDVISAVDSPVRARVLALSHAARIHAARGDIAEAVATSAESLSEARAIEDYLPSVLVSAILAAVAAGEHDSAQRLVDEFEAATQVAKPPPDGAVDLARACAAVQRPDVLRRLVVELELDLPVRAPLRAFAAGVLYESDDDFERAEREYACSAEGWHELGYVFNHALALHAAGRCGLRAGSAESTRFIHDACAIFEQLGAKPLAAEAETLLARTNV